MMLSTRICSESCNSRMKSRLGSELDSHALKVPVQGGIQICFRVLGSITYLIDSNAKYALDHGPVKDFVEHHGHEGEGKKKREAETPLPCMVSGREMSMRLQPLEGRLYDARVDTISFYTFLQKAPPTG